MVIVGLERVPGSPDDRCEQFLKCIYDRIEHGPPENREPGAADRREVELSESIQPVQFHTADLTFDEAKELVAEAATQCDPAWDELYRFPRDDG